MPAYLMPFSAIILIAFCEEYNEGSYCVVSPFFCYFISIKSQNSSQCSCSYENAFNRCPFLTVANFHASTLYNTTVTTESVYSAQSSQSFNHTTRPIMKQSVNHNYTLFFRIWSFTTRFGRAGHLQVTHKFGRNM